MSRNDILLTIFVSVMMLALWSYSFKLTYQVLSLQIGLLEIPLVVVWMSVWLITLSSSAALILASIWQYKLNKARRFKASSRGASPPSP